MSGGFQTQAYDQPAAFVAGDRVSQNPMYSFDVGPGGLVAGPSGVTVGRFAWVTPPADPNGTPSIANSNGSGPVSGFVMRSQQALNTTYLSPAGNTIKPGYQMALQISGDFAVVNDGATQALPGQKAYADLATGKVTFAATGAPTTGGSATGSIAASTGSFTGSIVGDLMTITAVGSGVAVVGGTLSGSGVASGTKITSQVSGTAGGVGTYRVSIPEQSVAAGTTISETYGTFTAASALTGAFGIGDVLTGSGISVTTTITALGTGAGGLGTYIVDVNTVVSSTTISAQSNVETKWYARSSGLAGEVVKISDTPLG